MTRMLNYVAAAAVLLAGFAGATAMPVAAADGQYEENSDEDFLNDVLDLNENDVDAEANAEDNDVNANDNDVNVNGNDVANGNNVEADTGDIASDNDANVDDSGNVVVSDTLDTGDLL